MGACHPAVTAGMLARFHESLELIAYGRSSGKPDGQACADLIVEKIQFHLAGKLPVIHKRHKNPQPPNAK
jgi:hypothetical protein